MYRWKLCVPALLCLVAIPPFVWWLLPTLQSIVRPSSPRQYEEVMQIPQQLGLHYRGDCEDGRVQMRLLLSESPLTWERANGLVIGRGEQSDWLGTVAIMQSVREFPPLTKPMTPWGNFLLYGDPALINKLTGRTD